MNRILLLSLNSRVLEGGYEVDALVLVCLIVRKVHLVLAQFNFHFLYF